MNIETKIKMKMDASLTKHLTTQTMDYRQVFSILVPVFIDQAFLVMFNFLNTAMVSSSGVSSVSAVNMVDSLNMFLLNVFIAMATGGTVLVAQYKGNGNEKMVSKSAEQAISLVTVASVVITVILLIIYSPTLTFLFGKADAEVMSKATTYMIASYISYPAFAIVSAVTCVLRGAGNTKSALGLSLIMNISYLFFNIVFITIMDLDVLGLSISMNVARYLAAAVSLYYIFKMNFNMHISFKGMKKFDWYIQKKMISVAIPFAAEQVFFNGGKLLTQTFVVGMGTYALTTNAISTILMNLSQLMGVSIHMSVITVVGHCIGNNALDDAKKYIRKSLLFGSFAMLFMGLILTPILPWLIAVFNPPQEIIPDITKIALVGFLIAQPLVWTTSFVLSNALKAAGDTKFTSIAAMCSMWVFRVLVGYLFGVIWDYGIVGVWMAMMLEWVVRSIIFVLRYRGTKWHSHRLID